MPDRLNEKYNNSTDHDRGDRQNPVFNRPEEQRCMQKRGACVFLQASVRFFPIGQRLAGEGQRAFTEVDFQHIPGLCGFRNTVRRQAQV